MIGDYEQGLKREVAETKFLIHDLRVEKFVNEVIHFHVTLNTDLEIHNADQAQILHEEDLKELKARARDSRESLKAYSNAVRSFSPDRTVLQLSQQHVQDVYEVCELILDPMWGRVDKVLSFLPEDCRSVASRNHYRNCIHWICGVYYRIQHFLDESRGVDSREFFDVAADIEDFTRSVIRGYVVEKSKGRVELLLGSLDSAVIEGNRHRFRRMYFNLVMNAVDAMEARKVGVLRVDASLKGDRIVLKVEDNGAGMPSEKIRQLLTDQDSLDGELHSLGFVFVRQTIADLGGGISIESDVGKGTTILVSLPHRPDAVAAPRRRSRCEKYEVHWSEPEGEESESAPAEAVSRTAGTKEYGARVHEAYRKSLAAHRGCIFAMAVTEEDQVDFFTLRPYEELWNITHEDLAPMFYQATMRGRLEEDESGEPTLILKAPQIVREYFEFKEIRENEWSAERFVRMVHDEYIRVARTLLETGLPEGIAVELTELRRFLPDNPELDDGKPIPLRTLARLEIPPA